MKKLFLMLGFILLVALVQASPPPGEMPAFNLEKVAVVATQNDVFVVVAPVFCTLAREVAHRPTWSLHQTVNKTPAEEYSQELTALINTNYNIEFTLKHPPSLYTMKGNLNNDPNWFSINRQHTNYGYPLSANRFFS